MRITSIAAGIAAACALALSAMPATAGDQPDMQTAAKVLFSRPKLPSDQPSHPVGFYAKGCLAGGVQLPINGPDWQVMRLSRNRNWGMPQLVNFLEKFANDAHDKDGWPGLLIGDMSQPRGGPMPTGHASHQIGLDVDIWYDPMPSHWLSRDEREKTSARSLTKAGTHFDMLPERWPPGLEKVLKRAASYPEVERIFVNPGVKKRLCETAGADRDWLRQLRPYYLHNDHFHVRLRCPAGATECTRQAPTAAGDGCGKDLDYWLSGQPWKPPPKPVNPPPKPTKPVKPPPPLTLAGLPKPCVDVLYAPDGAGKPAYAFDPLVGPGPMKASATGGSDPIGKVIGRDGTGSSVGN